MLNEQEKLQNKLKELLYYDNGELLWRINGFKRTQGKPIGLIRKDGYRFTRFEYKCYLVHRLIWIYHFGTIPKGMQIDHIDGIRSNNQITNLRLVTPATNRKNAAKHKKTKNKYPGVKQVGNNFCVSIGDNGKTKYLGTVYSLDEAKRLRKRHENLLGYHENHGRQV